MQEKGNWITNKYIRVTNPLRGEDNFVGTADHFDFKKQQKYFDLLKATLEPFNIQFQTVYAGSGSFVVDTNSAVVWYKRTTKPTSTSANHFLYLGKDKITVMNWLNLSEEARANSIKEMNESL